MLYESDNSVFYIPIFCVSETVGIIKIFELLNIYVYVCMCVCVCSFSDSLINLNCLVMLGDNSPVKYCTRNINVFVTPLSIWIISKENYLEQRPRVCLLPTEGLLRETCIFTRRWSFDTINRPSTGCS